MKNILRHIQQSTHRKNTTAFIQTTATCKFKHGGGGIKTQDYHISKVAHKEHMRTQFSVLDNSLYQTKLMKHWYHVVHTIHKTKPEVPCYVLGPHPRG